MRFLHAVRAEGRSGRPGATAWNALGLVLCLAGLAQGRATSSQARGTERPEPGLVTGHVRAHGGGAILRGGRLTLEVLRENGRRQQAMTQVGDDGAYRVHIDAGTVEEAYVTVFGHPPTRRRPNVSVQSGERVVADFELDPSVVLQGRAYDVDTGVSIPGVGVSSARRYSGRGVRTGPDGVYELGGVGLSAENEAGQVEFELEVTAPEGYRLATAGESTSTLRFSSAPRTDGIYGAAIALERADAQLRGLVFGAANGRPVASGRVSLVDSKGHRLSALVENGVFTIRGCAPGSAHVVIAERRMSWSHRAPPGDWRDVNLEGGAVTEVRFDLHADRGATVVGTLRDADTPISGWIVELRNVRSAGTSRFELDRGPLDLLSARVSLITRTGEEGTFRFENLPPGAYDLAAREPRRSEVEGEWDAADGRSAFPRRMRIEVRAGEFRKVAFSATRPLSLHGRVVSAEELVEGLRVEARTLDGTVVDSCPVQPSGRFFLSGLAPKSCRVLLRTESGELLAEAVGGPENEGPIVLTVEHEEEPEPVPDAPAR